MTAPNRPAALTKADTDALKQLPAGWFTIHRVPFMVKNPRYRCDRLTMRGMLESRVQGTYPMFHTEWRKIADKVS